MYGSMASNAGKGIVGWRAPPKPKQAADSQVKVPTQTQLDAAKRLSLGLSVARSANGGPVGVRKSRGSQWWLSKPFCRPGQPPSAKNQCILMQWSAMGACRGQSWMGLCLMMRVCTVVQEEAWCQA